MRIAATRLPIGFVVFVLSSVINPAYITGCFQQTEEQPTFGEADMLRSLDYANDMGRWTFDYDDVTYEVELSLMQKRGEDQDEGARAPSAAPLFARAYACGSRTFYQSAAACGGLSSELVLEGTLTLRRLDPGSEPTVLMADVDVVGGLQVEGSHFSNPDITLLFGGTTLDTGLVALHSTDGKEYALREFRTPTKPDQPAAIAYPR